MRTSRLGFVVLIIVTMSLGTVRQAFAGISVVPGVIEIIADRNDAATGTCKVTNTGDNKIHIVVQPEDWRKGLKGKRGGSVSDWLMVAPREMDIEPGKSGEFTYHIKVGPEAAGENAAQIFFCETMPGTGTQIQARVGVILYVAVRGTFRLDGEITDIKIFTSKDKKACVASAQVAVKNTGNAHIRPVGDVKVYNSKGNFMLAVILTTGWGILPDETYTYQGSGRGPELKKGKYRAVATISYGKQYKQEKDYTEELYFDVDDKGNVVVPVSDKKQDKIPDKKPEKKPEKKPGVKTGPGK